MTVAVGGFGADNHPMALVREIIRNGTKDLTIIASATAGLEIDLLIGAGCVKKLIAPYVGQEMYCPIGHNFRKYSEAGQIELWECSEYILYAGLFAAHRCRSSSPGAAASAPAFRTSTPTWSSSPIRSAGPRRSSRCRRCVPTGR